MKAQRTAKSVPDKGASAREDLDAGRRLSGSRRARNALALARRMQDPNGHRSARARAARSDRAGLSPQATEWFFCWGSDEFVGRWAIQNSGDRAPAFEVSAFPCPGLDRIAARRRHAAGPRCRAFLTCTRTRNSSRGLREIANRNVSRSNAQTEIGDGLGWTGRLRARPGAFLLEPARF